ncbi:UDP-N-acetylmuramate dehydrogenase [Mongoliitalea daihaiensis]|uniref:UDP-N-acetylmuramate dehydrogenase n=1 Tax=Mongoliitalea daihaiensis TaxID=2782006 RepID=UPI001F257D8E|nr:UDP-N-acetylmuramate dehydrogenase [Mongoliitalea daihaiensis]UJP64133.1 UDP-N-acetylmuramate dehydrogenase [Mongoliitalea daihaiensis]
MKIQENISLKPYNTFGIDKKARFFLEAHMTEDLKAGIEFAHERELPLLILGGGSNILLRGDFHGLVMRNCLEGIEVVREDDTSVWVEVGAGENWHAFVMYCLDKNWGGIENLSLIPGTVGASPMQNIGAYGVEIKDTFVSLEALHKDRLDVELFDAGRCQFGYRESIFKNTYKDQYIITKVQFKLSKTNHILHTSYGAIQEILHNWGIDNPSIQDVSKAVIQIRSSKLPDPKVIGNAGSFFKNPTISLTHFELLQAENPGIPSYPTDQGMKVPAAWLIQQCGWKGKVIGNIGVHKDQPLVLVNYGAGEGEDLVKLSQQIQESVFNRFGIALHPEVNFI